MNDRSIARDVLVGAVVLLGIVGWVRSVPVTALLAGPAPSPTSQELPATAVAPLARQEQVMDVCREGPLGIVSIGAMIISPASELAPADDHPGIDVGSGFFFDKQGHVVTNAHVVARDDTFEVTLPDRSRVPARVVGRDADDDLAVLQAEVPPDEISLLPLGDGQPVEIGQTVVAFGDPYGFERSVSVGVVSATGRRIAAPSGRIMAGLVQVDAATGPGSSGGPILSLRGEVVGVVAATITQGGAFAFAIPIERVRRIVPELIETGHYAHPWLGLSGTSPTPTLAKALGLQPRVGVLVTRVAAGGPASQGGLRPAQGLRLETLIGAGQVVIPEGADVVTRVDGRLVTSAGDLGEYLEAERRPGDLVALEVVRDGVTRACEVKLGERVAEDLGADATRMDASSDL